MRVRSCCCCWVRPRTGQSETWILGGRFTSNSSYVTASVLDPQSLARWRGSPVGPIIQMTPISVIGTPTPPTIMPPSLYNRLRDTFARFDDVTVVADAPEGCRHYPGRRALPRLQYSTPELEYAPDGSFTMTFRLVDMSDGTVAWSRSYEHLKVISDPREIKYPIVREVAATLFQPFEIAQSTRTSIKLANSRIPDPRYRCVIQALDYWRSFNSSMHHDARTCLEQAVAADPTFATGYALLSRVPHGNISTTPGDQPGDPVMLDHALDLAKRAIELKPHSARNYGMLLNMQVTRSSIDEKTLAAGETAMQLIIRTIPRSPSLMHRSSYRWARSTGAWHCSTICRAMPAACARPAWSLLCSWPPT